MQTYMSRPVTWMFVYTNIHVKSCNHRFVVFVEACRIDLHDSTWFELMCGRHEHLSCRPPVLSIDMCTRWLSVTHWPCHPTHHHIPHHAHHLLSNRSLVLLHHVGPSLAFWIQGSNIDVWSSVMSFVCGSCHISHCEHQHVRCVGPCRLSHWIMSPIACSWFICVGSMCSSKHLCLNCQSPFRSRISCIAYRRCVGTVWFRLFVNRLMCWWTCWLIVWVCDYSETCMCVCLM